MNHGLEHTVYLIPGLGVDGRLFQHIKLDRCRTIEITWEIPEKRATLQEYAACLAHQIDTTAMFSIIGVSFGGMVAVELSKMLKPHRTIILSTAKSRSELPGRYRVLKLFPVHRWFPERMVLGTFTIKRRLLRWGPTKERKLILDMLNDTNPTYFKRALDCVIHWENQQWPPNIVHLQGDRDGVFPIRRIVDPVLVKGGNHAMVYNRGEEISRLLNHHLAIE